MLTRRLVIKCQDELRIGPMNSVSILRYALLDAGNAEVPVPIQDRVKVFRNPISTQRNGL